jgi:pentatricopeptide repeat protein
VLDTTRPQSRRSHHDALVAPFTGQRRSLGIRKVGTRPTNLMEVESLSNSRSEPWFRSPQADSQKFRERAVLRRPVGDVSPPEVDSIADMWLGKRDPRIPKAAFDARRRELRWLKDPLEVAAFVKKELGKDKATEMLQLVRMASHSMQVVVSWNHIVDYYLAKERVSDALKVYNEVSRAA